MAIEVDDTRALLREIVVCCKKISDEKSVKREQPNKDSRPIPVKLVTWP